MSLKRNVIANYLGQGWSALMGIAFVPLYVAAMGVETYGLIGVFSVLQACMALLDMGLTPTLNREMARLRAGAHTPQSIRDLLRSLEFIYVSLALTLISVILVCATWLAGGWLRAERLPLAIVTQSIQIMGFVLATRWLEQVYRGALQGMEDQVWLNVIQALLATLRWGGAYLLVTYVWPSIIGFFAWQSCVSVLTTFVLVQRTYRRLPKPERRASFNLTALTQIRSFASSMFLGAVLSLLLTQADKVIVSKLLPLEQFGYYMLAATVSGGILQLIIPMNNAVYPRLTEQAERGDSIALALTYQRACEWMSAIIIPPGILLTLFPTSLLIAWTDDAALAHSVAPLLSVLALGTLFNGLMNLPYMLQLAHGWTSLALRVNSCAVLLIVPTLVWAVPRFGAIGAASAWLLLNAGYLLVNAHFMHRRILHAGKWPWYRDAIAAPLFAAVFVGIAFRAVVPPPATRQSAAVILLLAVGCICAAVILALPNVRRTIFAILMNSLRMNPR
jgi:O-antigen/teichoic acid export membrane protein